MSLSKIAVNRPVTTIMLMLIIVAFGAISFTRLPVDLFPKMELPMSVVIVNYPNAAPSEVESMVTRPVEQQIATVENLSALTSYSMDGMSVVLAEFENGTDMNFAGLDMREKVDMISDYLPDDATSPMIISMNPSMLPVSVFYVSADMNLTELNRLVNDEVLPVIERTEGVASASTFGGKENEIRIELNQESLDGYYLTLGQIAQLLAAENISLPSGTVTKGSREMIVRTVGDFKSIEDIKNISLTLPTKEVIRLGDVATVVEKEMVQTSVGRVNSVPAIGISITKQTVANTVQVAKKLESAMDDLKAKHPELTFTTAMNQADFINESILFVAESAIMGCILAILICLLFLRSFASTMVIALSIPTSIIATFILMFATGFTMNMLSLSGLAVGIGMLVDDSIVVMENIFRRRNEGLSAKDASIIGTREVTLPVFTATMTKIAVFLPIVFVESIAATIFKEFSFTIGFALICSLLVALTVIPMLCSRLLKIGDVGESEHPRLPGGEIATYPAGGRGNVPATAETAGLSRDDSDGNRSSGAGESGYHNVPATAESAKKSMNPLALFGRLVNRMIRYYMRVIRFALRYRKTVVSLSLVLLITSALLITVVGGELLPSGDEGALEISAEVPSGTSLEKTDEIMTEIEEYVATQVEGLRDYSLSIGNTTLLNLGSSGGGGGSVSVNLVDKNKRAHSVDEIAAKIADDLSYISGAKIDVNVSNQMSMSMGGSPIAISIAGDDFAVMEGVSNDFIEIVKHVGGTTNVQGSLAEGSPEVQVTPDRRIASSYGITTFQLAQTLNAALSGVRSTGLKADGQETRIVISLDGAYGDSVENMKQISIMSPTGQLVKVGDIADVKPANSPARIERNNQVRTVNVTADLNGRDLQSVTDDIEAALASYDMPAGYTYNIGGEAEEMQQSFGDLGSALLLSLLIIYMILASLFESLIQPFIIMLAIPFALTGAFLGLFLTNTPLSLVAFIGIIMLSGIVVNNSILLIDFINQNRAICATRDEAIINAGRYRFRPIFMTVLTTCLGLLPLALGFGSGGELITPMGITVIGGLIFSTLITLVLIPVIYSIIDDFREKSRMKREARRMAKRLAAGENGA
jgi:HAE1 family hydrophobic/amphiphilic exporter-1